LPQLEFDVWLRISGLNIQSGLDPKAETMHDDILLVQH
jgi:hypothetical protein